MHSLIGQYYLLAVEPIPTEIPQNDSRYFPGYFVGSTAPNNVEDGVKAVDDPGTYIKEIAEFLSRQPEGREILIAVHGYNTSLGDFRTDKTNADGVKGWYQSIRDHIAKHHGDSKPSGLIFLGYRWSSEVINGKERDSLGNKIKNAKASLPKLLNILWIGGIVGAITGLIAFFTQSLSSLFFGVFPILILSLSLIVASLIFTLIFLRLSGYFRDSYRANNYGVPDLVELIRQLDKAIVEASPGTTLAEKEQYWKDQPEPIKLSFIGHSMGGFAVTNAVRVLSDVFDRESIGNFDIHNKEKNPSARIGHVFSLGRLILVSPDIPAETIISGRANFLSSSLRRFEEAYLFSNEGDMALRLASTAANYFSFPAKTRAGGYRLGNVIIREGVGSKSKAATKCGIVNLDEKGNLLNVEPREDGGFEAKRMSKPKLTEWQTEIDLQISSFLSYLFVASNMPLSERQSEIILSPDRKPIAELFTYFDCTDYVEIYPERPNSKPKRMGVLTFALGKTSLSFWDYVVLTWAFATGSIDTHGGYFNNGDATDSSKARKKWTKPEAALSKQLIYGLACLGFQGMLESMTSYSSDMSNDPQLRKVGLQEFSSLCEAKGIQVLLSIERYNRDILNIGNPRDRAYSRGANEAELIPTDRKGY
jgi:hypothetical protein